MNLNPKPYEKAIERKPVTLLMRTVLGTEDLANPPL